MTTRRACVVAAMLCSSLPMATSAQTLRGTVLDAATGEPVMLAYVGLMAEGRNMVVAALASSSGDFVLEAPSSGSYFLYVSRAGYETLMDGLFEVGDDGVMDMRVGLTPAPIPIEPLVVESERDMSPLEAVGFYERAAIGNGRFLLAEEIERVAVERVTDAMLGIPGLLVDERRPMVGGPEVMQRPALVITRGTRRCSPTLYLDGAMVTSGALGPVRPDDYVVPREVEALEIYTRIAEVPVEYAAVDDCGVVLIWTKKR
jgi:hypothetical protein